MLAAEHQARQLADLLGELASEAREQASMRMRRDEGGCSTEAVVVTALLAALAIAVIAIIVIKVTQKANGINL